MIGLNIVDSSSTISIGYVFYNKTISFSTNFITCICKRIITNPKDSIIDIAGGETNIIFADTFKTGASTYTTSGDVTSDIKNYSAGGELKINARVYQDGVVIKFDAAKANTILKPYRRIFPTNYANFFLDKISKDNVYIARLSGVVVGEIHSLAGSTTTGSSGMSSTKTYQAILNPFYFEFK